MGFHLWNKMMVGLDAVAGIFTGDQIIKLKNSNLLNSLNNEITSLLDEVTQDQINKFESTGKYLNSQDAIYNAFMTRYSDKVYKIQKTIKEAAHKLDIANAKFDEKFGSNVNNLFKVLADSLLNTDAWKMFDTGSTDKLHAAGQLNKELNIIEADAITQYNDFKNNNDYQTQKQQAITQYKNKSYNYTGKSGQYQSNPVINNKE